MSIGLVRSNLSTICMSKCSLRVPLARAYNLAAIANRCFSTSSRLQKRQLQNCATIIPKGFHFALPVNPVLRTRFQEIEAEAKDFLKAYSLSSLSSPTSIVIHWMLCHKEYRNALINKAVEQQSKTILAQIKIALNAPFINPDVPVQIAAAVIEKLVSNRSVNSNVVAEWINCFPICDSRRDILLQILSPKAIKKWQEKDVSVHNTKATAPEESAEESSDEIFYNGQLPRLSYAKQWQSP